MPAPPAPGIVALEAIYVMSSQNVENVFHYHLGSTIDVAKLNAMCATYAGWATAHVGAISPATQLVKLQARDLTSVAGASVIYNVSPPIVGTSAGNPVPNNVTWSLKKVSGLRGRANRGRVYLVGMTTADLFADEQQVTSAFANANVANYLELMTDQITSNGAQEVIYHKATGLGTPVVSYAYADLYLDSQRRRLPGHNRHH